MFRPLLTLATALDAPTFRERARAKRYRDL